MTTVGTGKYTYTHIENWAKLPQGETFGMVSAIATDSRNSVYAFQRKDPPVLIFDPEGNLQSSWGNGSFEFAHGIYIENDIVYVADRDTSVCIMYTLDGKPIQMLGRHGVHSDTGCENPGDLVPRAAGPFNYPSELVPHSSGDLFVSDGYRNARVHRFSKDGQLKASWGEPGKGGPNQFHLVHSLIVDKDDRVVVCDRQNHRIQLFTLDGEFLEIWDDIKRPMDISVDQDECSTSVKARWTEPRQESAFWAPTEVCYPGSNAAVPAMGVGLILKPTSTWRVFRGESTST